MSNTLEPPKRGSQLLAWIEANEQSPDEADPAVQALFVPTDHYPGGPGKVEVMRERVAMGLPLWHRDDFRWDRGGGRR